MIVVDHFVLLIPEHVGGGWDRGDHSAHQLNTATLKKNNANQLNTAIPYKNNAHQLTTARKRFYFSAQQKYEYLSERFLKFNLRNWTLKSLGYEQHKSN